MSHTPPSAEPLSLAAIERLSAKEVAAASARGQAPLLVDVREDWEWDQGHIEGATWAPLSRLAEMSAPLAHAKERLIVTYCHHGVRSLKAAAWLAAQGFANVASMDGGIDAWATDVDASVGRY